MQYVTTCKHELYPIFYVLYFMYFSTFRVFLLISSDGKPIWSFVYVIIYCIGAGITTWMSISDGLDPYFFRQKMGKTRFMKEQMEGKVFISRQSRHFSFINIMIEVLFPICTLNWRVGNCVSRQGKGINRRNESTIFNIYFCSLWYHTHFWSHYCLLSLKLFPHNKKRLSFSL